MKNHHAINTTGNSKVKTQNNVEFFFKISIVETISLHQIDRTYQQKQYFQKWNLKFLH